MGSAGAKIVDNKSDGKGETRIENQILIRNGLDFLIPAPPSASRQEEGDNSDNDHEGQSDADDNGYDLVTLEISSAFDHFTNKIH